MLFGVLRCWWVSLSAFVSRWRVLNLSHIKYLSSFVISLLFILERSSPSTNVNMF